MRSEARSENSELGQALRRVVLRVFFMMSPEKRSVPAPARRSHHHGHTSDMAGHGSIHLFLLPAVRKIHTHVQITDARVVKRSWNPLGMVSGPPDPESVSCRCIQRRITLHAPNPGLRFLASRANRGTTLTCSAIVTACGRKTRRCVGVEGGRVRGDSCGRDGRRGFQRGRSGGLQGFCTVRRTLDADKRSIQPSFNPLVQSRRDKRNPQKQIRLLRPKTTAETKSQAAVFVCRAGVLQPCRNDKVGERVYI